MCTTTVEVLFSFSNKLHVGKKKFVSELKRYNGMTGFLETQIFP